MRQCLRTSAIINRLAANLSTFTSHVANIARMIELCEAPALVLLDEVGTGTDPEEGSALGVAVVDHFRRAVRRARYRHDTLQRSENVCGE